jgi:hypothetical protein
MTLELVPLSDDAAEKLRRGENDFLIIPRHFLDPEHPQRLLFEDRYCAVIWEGNTQVGDTLDAATYERLSHIAPMLGRPRSPTMEELLLQAQNVKRRIRVTTFDFSSMATALVGTDLVATMHARLALACARRLPIRVLPLPYELPPLAECLQWHRFQENDPCHIWLRGDAAGSRARPDAEQRSGAGAAEHQCDQDRQHARRRSGGPAGPEVSRGRIRRRSRSAGILAQGSTTQNTFPGQSRTPRKFPRRGSGPAFAGNCAGPRSRVRASDHAIPARGLRGAGQAQYHQCAPGRHPADG